MKRRILQSVGVVVLVLLALAVTPLLAQNGNVWNVSYFANPNWTAPAAMSMQSSYIDFNWGTVPPGPGLPSTNWTATMTSSAYFYYTGTYIFQALADDEISLQIDGVTYINTIGAGMSGKTVQVAVPLNLGTHNLTVQYRQYTGDCLRLSQLGIRQAGRRLHLRAATRAHAGGNPGANDAATGPHADAGVQSRVVVLVSDTGYERDDRVRQLHAVHPARPAAGQLLRLQRRLGRPEFGVDPDGAADRGMGQLHPRPTPVYAVGSAISRRCKQPVLRQAQAGSTTGRVRGRRRLRRHDAFFVGPCGNGVGHRRTARNQGYCLKLPT